MESNKTKGILVKLTQELVNFRVPETFKHKMTYPLPPYSTVIGMVHTLCGWFNGDYHPMNVSIKGIASGKIVDLQTGVVLTGLKYTPSDLYKLGEHDTAKGLIKTPQKIDELTELTLMLHIIPENADEVETIYNAFKTPSIYPSLGRYEDLVNIVDVQKVDITEQELEDSVEEPYGVYVPTTMVTDDLEWSLDSLGGVRYALNKNYEFTRAGEKGNDGKQGKLYRKFNKVNVIYTDDLEIWDGAKVLKDNFGNLVFPA